MAGDLSVTALYTSQVWVWGGLSGAELFATADAKRVFDVTNAVLGLARLARPDLSPLRYALLHRHAMIDHLLGQHSGSVLELAAGLSRRGAANCETRAYTEVDLPPVISKKRELLERTPEGRAVLAKLTLIAGDVTTAQLPPADLAIAEGLLMYLDGDARRRLFAAIPAPRLIFDLVPQEEEPRPGRIGKLLERAMKRFTGGRSFERDARTRDQIIAELHAAGFPDVTAYSSSDVATAWQLPHPERKTTMVVFSASRATRA
ncbi:MAG TPA: class I SAM-dependent methyltransferase [Kofleriaceae bacterium]|nr:class I SAM-dependent methyltransferase [Kofleriaceae bacterium]